jgi:hypothetical protein
VRTHPRTETAADTHGFKKKQNQIEVQSVRITYHPVRSPLRIGVPNVNELYATQMGKALRAWAGFNYQNWQAAAQFTAANKVNLAEALVWADKAISEPLRYAHARGRFRPSSRAPDRVAPLTRRSRSYSVVWLCTWITTSSAPP